MAIVDPHDGPEAAGPPGRPAVVPALAGYTGHLVRAAYLSALRHTRAHLPPGLHPIELFVIRTMSS
jgi:hypothetical protein